MKILDFLIGDTMKINFNIAQLSRSQRKKLLSVLDVLQSENQNEIEVMPVEFPIKFKVKLDDEIEMLLGWDPETDGYTGLTTPEPEPEPKPDPKQEPEKGELIAVLDNAGNVIAGPELVVSEIGQRVEALAQALIKLTKPLNTYQRGEVWIQFCTIYVKGIME